MSDLIGQSLGRYHILEQLGEGGMATVYKAYDTRLETEVAVKVIRTESIPPNILERALKRFEREAKALARLNHLHIVKVTDYGEYEGKPYLVMPYLPGGTLKQKMGKPMPWQEAIQLLIPIAEALGYAHSQNMIHRDVKPSNILLTERGEPLLTDFGIAKILDLEETLELTGTSAAVGTPEYMAPEQATAKTVDHRVDIYALGVVLYEMVTGRKPFVADTPLAVLIKHASEALPRPKQFVPNLSDRVEKILLKALAKSPDDRYQSMNELIAAFRAILDDKLTSPKTERRASNKAVQPKVEKPRPLPGPTPQKRSRSALSGRYIGLLAGGIVVVLGVWLGSRWIGSRLASVPTTTKLPTVTLSSTGLPVERIPAGQTPKPIVTPTDILIEVPLSATPILALGATQTSPIDGMRLHYIPAGTFSMGDTAEHAVAECQRTGIPPMGCEPDRFTNGEPVHQVYLDPYWMDETEITNAKYKLCVKAGVCQRPSTLTPYYTDDWHGDYPVVFVTWNDARVYCEWAKRRLPTEAEWEKAARGTDGRTYPWGEQIGIEYANYNTSPGDVTKVGSYELGKSPYGIYDMAGNVSEFVADLYDPDYYKTLGENVMNPKGPSQGGDHVIRGGEFLYNSIQSALRDATYRASNATGFRCALSVDIPSTSIPSKTLEPRAAQAEAVTAVPTTLLTEIADAQGVPMVFVPQGEFTMGNDNGAENEKPAHQVYLDAFYIDKYEVTIALYKLCVDAGVCRAPRPGSYTRVSYFTDAKLVNYPVIYTDWYMAKTFCEWRDSRLPTEAEWEKAARGTDGRLYPWGDIFDGTRLNFCDSNCIFASIKNSNFLDNYSEMAPVGTYPEGVSPYGIYNMSGNVSEWVADWYSADYYLQSPSRNPAGPASGSQKVSRGGGWGGTDLDVSTTVRAGSDPNRSIENWKMNTGQGFRCARDANP